MNRQSTTPPRAAKAAPTPPGELPEGRMRELARSHRFLKAGLRQRKATAKTLAQDQKHNARLLAQARGQQQRLRRLHRQLIARQEIERTKISHQLHDDVAQTLLGIHIRLLALSAKTPARQRDFETEMANIQQLVRESIRSIERFAAELESPRPPARRETLC